MSCWTYVNGTVTVSPIGRTQSEKRYILETVLDHLPVVSGSEENMYVHIVQKSGYSGSSEYDEFGRSIYEMEKHSFHGKTQRISREIQDEYILVVEGNLRDRTFDEAFKEFIKWFVRLGKRISIKTVLVQISDSWGKSKILQDRTHSWVSMLYETPSWVNEDGELNWAEYLMWENAKDSSMPMLLEYKYSNIKECRKEVEQRMQGVCD